MTEQRPDRTWAGIDIVKLVAGTLAAVSAAVVGSFLGVAGTLVGAAVASLIGTLGTELYARSLNRGYTRLRHTYAGPAIAPEPAPDPTPTTAGTVYPHGRPHWKRVALVAAVVFVLAMGAVSAVELLAGRSVSSMFGNPSGGGTTISSVGRKAAPTPTPTPSPTPTTPSAAPSAPTSAPPGGPSERPAPSTPATTNPTTGPPTPLRTPS
jgi:hypothetical protein